MENGNGAERSDGVAPEEQSQAMEEGAEPKGVETAKDGADAENGRERTKVITVAVLIAVIVVGVGFGLTRGRKMLRLGGPTVPKSLAPRDIELIDEKTLQFMTKPADKWKKLGSKDGRHLNPKTGTYSMVSPVECKHCGKKLPFPPLPKTGTEAEGEEAVRKRKESVICPHCGGYALISARRLSPDKKKILIPLTQPSPSSGKVESGK